MQFDNKHSSIWIDEPYVSILALGLANSLLGVRVLFFCLSFLSNLFQVFDDVWEMNYVARLMDLCQSPGWYALEDQDCCSVHWNDHV